MYGKNTHSFIGMLQCISLIKSHNFHIIDDRGNIQSISILTQNAIDSYNVNISIELPSIYLGYNCISC